MRVPFLTGCLLGLLGLLVTVINGKRHDDGMQRTQGDFLDSLSNDTLESGVSDENAASTESDVRGRSGRHMPRRRFKPGNLETIDEGVSEDAELENEHEHAHGHEHARRRVVNPIDYVDRLNEDEDDEEYVHVRRPSPPRTDDYVLIDSQGRVMEDRRHGGITSGGPSQEDRLIDDKLKFLVPYYELYERVGGPSSKGRRVGFVMLLALLLGVMFYLMYTISSNHLTSSLAHLSIACRMSPDMAGLTFLAFGNGAPDLFTALLGAEDAPEMILGSSIGSGLFVLTVVLGLVVIFARDPSQTGSTTAQLAFGLAMPSSTPRVKIGRSTFWRNALMYGGCIAALAVFVLRRRIPFWQPLLLMLAFFAYLATSVMVHYLSPQWRGKNRKGSEQQGASGQVALEKISKDAYEGDESLLLLEIERRRFKLQDQPLWRQMAHAIATVTEWREMSLAGRALWLLTAPLRLALTLTILPLPDPTMLSNPDAHVSRRLLAHILIPANPFFSVPLLGWLSGLAGRLFARASWPWVAFFYLSVSLLGACLLHLGASIIANPLSRQDGSKATCVLYGATVYSFCCCIAWIYVISNELVAALSALGLILGVSRTVMGCLVLAWGNSIGDLISDVALARNGAPQTAITAIFSGPVQNVLLTIGISFMAAAVRSADGTVKLGALRGDVHLSLALLVLVLLALLVLVPGYFAYRIPRYFGVMLVGVYVLYVPFGIWFGVCK